MNDENFRWLVWFYANFSNERSRRGWGGRFCIEPASRGRLGGRGAKKGRRGVEKHIKSCPGSKKYQEFATGRALSLSLAISREITHALRITANTLSRGMSRGEAWAAICQA